MWLQRCLLYPRHTKIYLLSLWRATQPLSTSSSRCLWWERDENHETFYKKSFYPGVICVRGARGKAAGSKAKDKPVEAPPPSDPKSDTVCKGANIFKDGNDPPLREDSEYPDWLWRLTEAKKSSDDLSPESTQYWRRLRKQNAHERNLIMHQRGRV